MICCHVNWKKFETSRTMLKPTRVEIDCVFQCSKCNTETWYTILELEHRKHLHCPCGQKTRLEPVHSVEVMYVGKAVQSFDGSGQQNKPHFPANDFVASLVALGHRKTDACALVDQYQDEHDGDDGKFLTFLLTRE